MKMIDFIKKNKVPTIATSVVLVAAVAVGVIFGVMKHKDNVEVKTSSAESSSEVSSVVEDSSSEAEASSEDSVSSVVSETEPVSTSSKTESVSSTQTSSQAPVSSAAQTSSKPVSSASSNVVSSKPVTSTPSNTTSSKPATSTPANSGGNTGTSSKWVCPDPAAHGDTAESAQIWCRNAQCHQDMIQEHQRAVEEAKNQKPIVYPEGQDYKTWCTTCNKPRGDGHNGTCYLHWEGDTLVHGNYD